MNYRPHQIANYTYKVNCTILILLKGPNTRKSIQLLQSQRTIIMGSFPWGKQRNRWNMKFMILTLLKSRIEKFMTDYRLLESWNLGMKHNSRIRSFVDGETRLFMISARKMTARIIFFLVNGAELHQIQLANIFLNMIF